MPRGSTPSCCGGSNEEGLSDDGSCHYWKRGGQGEGKTCKRLTEVSFRYSTHRHFGYHFNTGIRKSDTFVVHTDRIRKTWYDGQARHWESVGPGNPHVEMSDTLWLKHRVLVISQNY